VYDTRIRRVRFWLVVGVASVLDGKARDHTCTTAFDMKGGNMCGLMRNLANDGWDGSQLPRAGDDDFGLDGCHIASATLNFNICTHVPTRYYAFNGSSHHQFHIPTLRKSPKQPNACPEAPQGTSKPLRVPKREQSASRRASSPPGSRTLLYRDL
jgi:hypothetical protein